MSLDRFYAQMIRSLIVDSRFSLINDCISEDSILDLITVREGLVINHYGNLLFQSSYRANTLNCSQNFAAV
jgi:hypothetical protein